MTHPLIWAALRAHRGETSERFGVSVSEIAAMHHAVLAVLRELREPSLGLGTEIRSHGVSLVKWRRCLDAAIQEIEG